jgi:hypothetical protein
MSFQFDATAGTSQFFAGGGHLTFSHTCAAGANLLVVSTAGTGQAAVPFSISYNGVALTEIINQNDADGATPNTVSLWYLLNPATGSHTVDCVILNGGATVTVDSSSYIGAHPTIPLDTSKSDSFSGRVSSNPSTSITTGVNGALVVAAIINISGFVMTPTTLTALTEPGMAYKLNVGPAGAFAANWTMASTSFQQVLASFKPSPASFIGVNTTGE